MKTVIVIPAYNEQQIIRDTVLRVIDVIRMLDKGDIDLVLVDNGSTDATGELMRALESEYAGIHHIFESQQGKGNAVLKTWERLCDEYDFFVFMDADLATSLRHLEELISAIQEGDDVVIGSRHLPSSKVTREAKRKIASAIYHRLAKWMLKSPVSDFPCGFKAVSKKVVRDIVPQIEERTWFFDTELLYRAEQAGLSIREIGVQWTEPRSKENASRLHLPTVSLQYIQGLNRLRKLKKRP